MKQNVITLVNLHGLIMIRYCITLLNKGAQKNLSDIFHTFREEKRKHQGTAFASAGGRVHSVYRSDVWFSLRKLSLELGCGAQFTTAKPKRPFL